jgi:hypothetical protein
MPDQGELAHRRIALAQRHPVKLRQPHQLLARRFRSFASVGNVTFLG